MIYTMESISFLMIGNRMPMNFYSIQILPYNLQIRILVISLLFMVIYMAITVTE